ncbi:aminotransferase class I/II-fold pyridoxal phosphate-dependent enzyme [Streptomyces roseochromogenus]|nr:aminotransferase class I/II-fold pyridoxal phosphate-dependent enzyme [Streptomyces roseochromogenus]
MDGFIARSSGIAETARAYVGWRGRQSNQVYGRPLCGLPGAVGAMLRADTGDTQDVINMASYNYLGLAGRPEITQAVREVLESYGAGSGGAPLACGTTPLHGALERDLAQHCGQDDAALFSSGYAANLGLIAGMMRPGDTVVLDRHAHASAVDGVRLSGAQLRVFRHNDPEDLETVLKQVPCTGERLVCIEGLYSMDGDVPELKAMVDVAGRYGARVVLDEAHSEFCFGATGGGLTEVQGVKVDFHVGTLSKALCVQGGFIAGDAAVMQWLRDLARSRLFSGSLSPVLVAAATAALRISRSEPQLRERLAENSRLLRERMRAQGIDVLGSDHVVPVVTGEEETCVRAAHKLSTQGIHVFPVVYPAVGIGRARLRMTVTADHQPHQLGMVADALVAAVAEARGD